MALTPSLGRFLEISVCAPAILESVEFWERVGFRQAVTNDVWTHPYALLTDGALPIGLHRYEFDSPALTFVRPELAKHLSSLRERGVEFAFAKVGDDEFNEAGFTTPDGQMVALLESRTYSPPPHDDEASSLLGSFDALVLPVRRVDRTLPFLARLGVAVLEYDEDDPHEARLATGALHIRLSEDVKLKGPQLAFVADDLDARADLLDARVGGVRRLAGGALALRSPENLDIVVRPA